MEEGLAIVLPGIDGCGPLNWSVARGLEDGGFRGGIVIHDWTTGYWGLTAYHLCAYERNRREAAKLAQFVMDYQDAFPGRPVHLVGHSAGGVLAAWALEALPEGRSVETAILMAPSLSPQYSLAEALRKVGQLWNFWSPYDLFFLVFITSLMGTMDRRHSVSAGFRGFTIPTNSGPEIAELYRRRFQQRRYKPSMARQYHLGGHFGWANRVFVAETLTPLLLDRSR